ETGNKAPSAIIGANRMGLGDVRGGALRLAKADTSITIGEGAETTLSALYADSGRAAWAALSASLMPSMVLPAQVRDVILLEDADQPDNRGRRAGPDAVARFAGRLLREG